LFNYFLTGVKVAEYSIASTSQMLDAHKRVWSEEILEAFDLPSKLLKTVIPSGTIVGKLSDEVCQELGVQKADVIAVASHDTQSAILAAPAAEEDFIFLSSGTWSLIGTELKEPIINEKSVKYNITNEGGFGGRIQFLKNVIGTWLLQECRRNWRVEGQDYSYDTLEELALGSTPFQSFIDPADSVFMAPGDMSGRIKEYCQKTGQIVPQTIGEIVRCIFESLSMKYREAFEMLRDCTGKDYRTIHLMGGGSKSPLLCQMTASSCGINVLAGPVEATALGNIAGQLIALGEISDIAQARRIISQNIETTEYFPQDAKLWSAAYQRYMTVIHCNNSDL
jgi:rhamnulokinase/L-fuculokinase